MNQPGSPDFCYPSEFEIAVGYATGRCGAPRRVRVRRHPREVLEQVIREQLSSGDCFVHFSGGRDSSVILALATKVARADGFQDPIAITERYPRFPQTQEIEWQELVIRTLNIRDWVRLDSDDQNDLLGPSAQQSLRSFGVMWPATLHTKNHTLNEVRGARLLTGEGGDMVFGRHRSTALKNAAAAWNHARRPADRAAALRRAAESFGPRLMRSSIVRRKLQENKEIRPWLTAAAQREAAERAFRDESLQPLRYSRSVSDVFARRFFTVVLSNYQAMASRFGVTMVHPFFDGRFVSALENAGGMLGPSSRTEIMRSLFADVLPAQLLTRKTKAAFESAFINIHSLAFARAWSGRGVGTDFVDLDVLAERWSAGIVTMPDALLLQQAWLYEQGLGIDGKPLQQPKTPTPQSTSSAEPPELATP